MPVERTCIICRKKEEKKTFFRLCQREEKYYWDKTGKAQARGYYVCPEKECLGQLAKHKKIKMEMQDLYEMGKEMEKREKNYMNIFQIMKHSNALSFGMKMVLEEMEHTHLLVLATDISEKYARQLQQQAREKNIPLKYFGRKKDLGKIFGKEEVTVIAVKDKKMARGLVDKMK
ncbi:DUF448 domain-containing protein [Fusobacterium necrophorum]|uniref:ABC transporter n=1 Tax=Fusobacterium necrophorum DJ-2 TaxID=1441737 RepID=A0AB73C4G9_9FUSO|nr:DUF448 domain-containing protein [Fusobacterium necrophorum]KDE61024.1 ABC transporter [Fusobacterium necrophorum DJ-1]KDE73003.1 ABC transporter [Fusobacterium necrophorum DJ-2]MBR8822288.1 hypothetical protein [Fusobacterium necrophorum]MCF0161760.1 DUF448 domain-containing protein [Fusobacterium necrophorum]